MITCIYLISNTINSRIYVGSAVDFRLRKNKHITHLNNNIHCNNKLQRFVNKYGIGKLCFKPIELCDKNKLIEREQFYIDKLDSVKRGFNILQTAGSWLNHKHSEESKRKQSASKKGIQSTGMLGKKHSKETKQLIIAKAIGRKQSNETIQKRVAKNIGKSRPISAIETVKYKLSKLSDNHIHEIRDLLKQGLKQADIGKRFGVCQRSISRISQGISYSHVINLAAADSLQQLSIL